MKTIVIAEQFFSIQGEGATMGVPAFFLRLTGCNLMCGGKGTEKDQQLHDGATWRCDTIEVWQKGSSKDYEQIFTDWSNESAMPIRELLSKREAHIVITGGEPLLQQKALLDFLEWLRDRISSGAYIEIETNGTRVPSFHLNEFIEQYNVSPKLSNSGMPAELRINNEAMNFFARQSNAWFKFVISGENDLVEVMEDFVKPFRLDPRRVYLMPAASDRDDLTRISADVAALCKREALRFSSRLQLAIFNQKTGV